MKQNFYNRFVFLSLVLLGSLVVICSVFGYLAYRSELNKMEVELNDAAQGFQTHLNDSYRLASHMMSFIGKQAADKGLPEITDIEQALKFYPDSEKAAKMFTWSLFSWVDSSDHVIATTYAGKLDEPLYVGHRNYAKMSKSEPWVLHLDDVTIGVVSGLPTLPGGMGVTDQMGQYVGLISMGFDVTAFQDFISKYNQSSIVGLSLVDDRWRLIAGTRLEDDNPYFVALDNEHFPFTILASYKHEVASQRLMEELLPIIMQGSFVALGLIVFLFVFRQKIVSPAIASETLAKEFEAKNEAKNEFLATMSHDLRTPLNAILGFSEMIESGLLGPLTEKQKEYLRDIHRSGGHLLDLINDILDLSKVEAGKMELSLAYTRIDEIVRNSMRDVALMAKERQIGLHVSMEKGLPDMLVDARRIRQIVHNLLSNAVKFTENKGDISVDVWRDEEVVCVSVKDSGIGMTKDEMELALTRFGQVNSQIAQRNRGTGLGLPLAQSLTKLHGGQFEMESLKGHGTTVTIRLPIVSVQRVGYTNSDALSDEARPSLRVVS